MPPSHQESAPLAYILALPVKNGPLPEKLKSSKSTAALDEYFQPVKNLGIWVFCSHRATLTLQKYRCQAIQSLVWTDQKYWTIPWERSVLSNFSAGQKICPMPCEHKIWLSKLASKTCLHYRISLYGLLTTQMKLFSFLWLITSPCPITLNSRFPRIS